MNPVFLEGSSRLLLILHAVGGFAAVGATTHMAIYTTGLWLGRDHWGIRARLFGKITTVVFLVPFGVGLLIYPSYRVHARMDYLDAHVPQAVALFDVKEHWAAFALPLVLGATLLSRWSMVRSVRGVLAILAVSGAVLVWAVALIGLYVTSFRAIGVAP